MKRLPRDIIAGVLTVLFLAINFSPLATLVVRSKTIASAIAGECSGDCDTCGCSVESRASHSCCCRQKRAKNQQHAGHEGSDSINHEKKQHDTETTLSCNRPCGSGKLLAWWGMQKYESLPYQFSGLIYSPQEGQLFPSFHPQLTTRYCEPPKHPPKLTSLA